VPCTSAGACWIPSAGAVQPIHASAQAAPSPTTLLLPLPLQVLTSLHWSVPRPLSEAEHELRSQLDSYEKQQGQLAVDWALLKRSVKAAVQRVQPGGSAAAGSKAAGLGSMAGGVRSTSATVGVLGRVCSICRGTCVL
jgi:hypothetical protein